MTHLGPLRSELFKYRKRKKLSIDGSVGGISYQRHHRFTTPQLGSRPSGFRSLHQKDYLGQIPNRYRPNMFSPSTSWTEYQSDHDDFTHSSKTPQAHHPPDRALSVNPISIASSDELSFDEQFLMNMVLIVLSYM